MKRLLLGGALPLMIVVQMMSASNIASQSNFKFGTNIAGVPFWGEPGWFNLDSAEALRLNELGTWAVKSHPWWTIHPDSLASIGMSIRAGNPRSSDSLLDTLIESVWYREQGYIIRYISDPDTTNNQTSYYNVWQAEDTKTWNGVYGLSHSTGVQTTDGWKVTAGDDSGDVQSGPAILTPGGPVAIPRVWRIQYRLKFDTTVTLDDSIPVARIYGSYPDEPVTACAYSGCTLLPTPYFSSVLTVDSFKVNGNLNQWKEFTLDFRYVKDGSEVCSTCTYGGENNANLDFKIEWYGHGTLEIDWTRCVDFTNGKPLVLDPDPFRRNLIADLASNFKNDNVYTWFAAESGYFSPASADAYLFVDSLVRSASDNNAFVHTDMALRVLEADTLDARLQDKFDFHMYRMLSTGELDYLYPWITPFENDTSWALDVDLVNANWYDMIARLFDQQVMRWTDSIARFRVIPYVQVSSTDSNYTADPSPTMNDVVCQTFLYLAHGAKGINLYRYDGGIFSNGKAAWGLTYNSGGARRYTKRHEALRTRVSPLLMPADSTDTTDWGSLLLSLDWRGAGLADSLRNISGPSWNKLSSFTSSAEPAGSPYMEIGFFQDSSATEDYVMFVNRRTVPSTEPAQHFRAVLDANELNSAGPHYYLIDLNPDDTLRGSDTILIGESNNDFLITDSIPAGGVKFYKIAAAPNRISGTDFPEKWWGHIRASSTVWVSGGRTLRLAPGVKFEMDGDSINSSLSLASINNSLIAMGTSDSLITITGVKAGQTSPKWEGLRLANNNVCSLQYCSIVNTYTAIAILENTSLNLHHVTIKQPIDYAITSSEIISGTGGIVADSCDIYGPIKSQGGYVVLSSSTLHGSDTTIYMTGTCSTCADSLVLTNIDSLNVGDVGILVDGKTGRKIRLDNVSMVGSGVGIEVHGNHTVSIENSSFDSLEVGVDVDSSSLTMRDCTMEGIYDYGIYALDGNATIVLDSAVDISGRPDTTVGIAAGAGSHLVVRYSSIHDGYIGLEIRGDGPDSVTDCAITDNTLYGIYFNEGDSEGDSADYSADNVIENDTASAVNVGLHVLKQSLKSVRDSVKGGYNWVYNINTYATSDKTVSIDYAVVLGKPGDDWGLVLNGIASSGDSVTVDDTEVLETFSQAHVYIRQINAKVKDCLIESTDDSETASPVGVYVRDNNSGFIGCTNIRGQDECVKRFYSNSAIEWTDIGTSYADAGFNEFSTSLSYTFNNIASDTVDVRRSYWGASPPDTSQMSQSGDNLNYGNYQNSHSCFPAPPGKIAAEVGTLPHVFALAQNYPNPFNPMTSIDFSLEYSQPVRITIYNIMGRLVQSFDLGEQAAGPHSLIWDGNSKSGTSVGSGVYFYRIDSPDFVATKKMLILK